MDINVFSEKFRNKYYRFVGIMDSDLWVNVKDLLEDDSLIDKFVFANDVLRVPPVKTFLLYYNLDGREFENTMKQNIGAVFGCLFFEMLGYKGKTSVSCRISNVRLAALFIKEDK